MPPRADVDCQYLYLILAHKKKEKWAELVFRQTSTVDSASCAGGYVSQYPFVALSAMHSGVACRAERDQIFLSIGSRMTAELPVVHFKIGHRAARLTSPAIAPQDLLSQIPIRHWIQSQAGGFWANRAHDAFSLRPPRNACRCSPGRNLKNLVIENSSVSGSPLSRLAPARKSAQIISKQ